MESTTLAFVFLAAQQAYQLPPGLLQAVCWVESKHVVDAMNGDDRGSPSLGLCQLKLETARGLGFEGTPEQLRFNPQVNANYAAKYLRKQLDRYSGAPLRAVAAYNAGSCRLNSHGQVKNRNYVRKVLNAWQSQ